VSLTAAKCNNNPFTSAKNRDSAGIFGARQKFFGSVKGLVNYPLTDCKTVYPGSIPGVASDKFNDLVLAGIPSDSKLPPDCHRVCPRNVLFVSLAQRSVHRLCSAVICVRE
jgi:hypothetical protein